MKPDKSYYILGDPLKVDESELPEPNKWQRQSAARVMWGDPRIRRSLHPATIAILLLIMVACVIYLATHL